MRFRFPRRPTDWLVISLGLFVVLSFAFQYAKFAAFDYDGLDLAIYTQVVHESSEGRLFAFTIHPHSYLGDHIELFLLVLVPFYRLIPSPLTLLALQTVALGLGALPLFSFTRRRLGSWWGLGAAAAYLLSPFVWNTNAFEFHLLPFAIPFVFAAIDAYDRRSIRLFWLWSVLALTVREDVALVVAGLGLLGFLQRRRWTWWLPMFVASFGWFVIALRIATAAGTLGQYKFLRFYQWLGPDLPSIIANFFGHPFAVIRHFFTLRLLAFVVGIGLPVAFLPLGAALWLVPTLPVLLQLGLGQTLGELTLRFHYISLFIPFLYAAAIVSLDRLFRRPHQNRVLGFFATSPGATAFLLASITLYCFIVIGPIRGLLDIATPTQAEREQRRLRSGVVRLVPPDAPLATGYALLSRTAERSTLASLHYVYLGTEQYSERPYRLSDGIRTVLIDESDFLLYHVVYPEDREKYRTGDDRYREMLSDRGLTLKLAVDDLALYGSDGPADSLVPIRRNATLPASLRGQPATLPNGLRFHGWASPTDRLQIDRLTVGQRQYPVLPLTLYWSQTEPMTRHNSFVLQLERSDGKKYAKEYPFAPLDPQSGWTKDEVVATERRFFIPSDFLSSDVRVSVALIDSAGSLTLSPSGSITPHYRYRTTLGTLELGKLTPPPVEPRTE